MSHSLGKQADSEPESHNTEQAIQLVSTSVRFGELESIIKAQYISFIISWQKESNTHNPDFIRLFIVNGRYTDKCDIPESNPTILTFMRKELKPDLLDMNRTRKTCRKIAERQ